MGNCRGIMGFAGVDCPIGCQGCMESGVDYADYADYACMRVINLNGLSPVESWVWHCPFSFFPFVLFSSFPLFLYEKTMCRNGLCSIWHGMPVDVGGAIMSNIGGSGFL